MRLNRSSAQVIGLRQGYKESVHSKVEKTEYWAQIQLGRYDNGCSWEISLYCFYFLIEMQKKTETEVQWGKELKV